VVRTQKTLRGGCRNYGKTWGNKGLLASGKVAGNSTCRKGDIEVKMKGAKEGERKRPKCNRWEKKKGGAGQKCGWRMTLTEQKI